MDVAYVFERGVPLWHGVVWDALCEIELDVGQSGFSSTCFCMA